MEAQHHWPVFYMPWPDIALSQGDKKQRRIKESRDETILWSGNCLICHVALSVAKKKRGIAQLRLALGQFKTKTYILQIQKTLLLICARATMEIKAKFA